MAASHAVKFTIFSTTCIPVRHVHHRQICLTTHLWQVFDGIFIIGIDRWETGDRSAQDMEWGHTNINVPLKVCACYVQLCLWYCGIIDFSSESDSLSNTEWGPYYQTGSPVSELKNKKIYILQQSATQNFSINNFSFCWTARHGDVLAVTIQILCWCRHCLCHAL